MSALSLARKPEIRRSLAEGLLACSDFQREDSERLAFGIAAHDFFALYWRHLQAVREESDLTAVRGLAGQAWARTPGLLQSRYDEFMALAERFAETHLGNLRTLVAVEETQVLDVGWAVLTCTIDRIDRIDEGDPDDDATWECIWDGKTELGEMDHEFQIKWYVQSRFLRRPRLQRISFVLDPVRLGRPDDPIDFERGQLDEWWEITLDGLRRRLATPPGNPTGNPKCYECALRTACARSLTDAREMPTTVAEADEQLAEHHRMAAGAATRWEGQRCFYEAHEPRVVQGQDVGYMTTLEESFEIVAEPAEFWDWAEAQGWDARGLAKPTIPNNRAMRDLAVAAGIARRYFKKPTFKTRIHKPLGRKQRRAEALAAEEVSDAPS